jgi:hypothetical protein
MLLLARAAATISNCAVADLIYQLLVGNHSFDVRACSGPDLDSTTFVSLTFPNHDNSVRGEVIGLGRSGSPDCCPHSGPYSPTARCGR